MPQLSRKVAGETGQLVQKILAKETISIRPRRITAALVLSPNPRPSQKPAPTATMFCSDDEVIYIYECEESLLCRYRWKWTFLTNTVFSIQ